MKQYIENFLIKNDFKKSKNVYTNNNCSVIIYDSNIGVRHGVGETFCKSHNLYWIIGYLTWFGLIDKNYQK